jgi:hypothetical protein
MAKKKPKLSLRTPPSDDSEKIEDFIKGGSSESTEEPEPEAKAPQDAASGSDDPPEESAQEEEQGASAEKTVERRQTTIYFDREVFRKLKVYCAMQGLEMSKFVNDAIDEKLNDIGLPNL